MFKLWIILNFLCLTALFSGCITTSNLKKAKLERRSLSSNGIISSNLDSNGTAHIIFRQKTKLYGLTVPLDSIIKVYSSSGFLEHRNYDSTSDLVGVEYHEKKYFILYKQCALRKVGIEELLPKNDSLFTIYRSKVYVSNKLLNPSVSMERSATSIKTIAFFYRLTDTTEVYRKNRSNYVIARLSEQTKKGRYFLLPFTVSADAITLPFQALGYGSLALLSWAMKY